MLLHKTLLIIGLFSMLTVFGQEATKVKFSSPTSKLGQFIESLEAQSDYSVSYSSHYVDLDQVVYLNQAPLELNNVLDQVIGQQLQLNYKLTQDVLVIYPEREEPMLVRGRIIDEWTGQALIGVQVAIAEGGSSVVSDAQGEFAIELSPEQHQLSVHHPNYNSINLYTYSLDPQEQVALSMDPIQSVEETEVMVYPISKIATNTLGIINISDEQVANINFGLAGTNDPVGSGRVVPSASGVSANSAQLGFRNCSPHETSVTLDGVPIYRPTILNYIGAVNGEFIENETVHLTVSYSI